METLIPNAHYFIFSDNPKKAKDLMPISKQRFSVVTSQVYNEYAYQDLWLMSQCRHFIIILGNLLKTTGQNGSSRYFGFDSFKSYTARDLQIEKGLSSEKWENNSYDFVSNRIKKHNLDDVSLLIEGDIRKTLPKFVASQTSKKSPNTLFCRLIYIDTSAYEPSILGLDLLWKHIVPGGLVIIDQRTQGGEWRAAIEFCEKNKIKPKSINAFNSAPIYLKKE